MQRSSRTLGCFNACLFVRLICRDERDNALPTLLTRWALSDKHSWKQIIWISEMHSGLFLESKINIWSGQILQTRQQKYATELSVWVMHNSLFSALIYEGMAEQEGWKINRDVQMMWCVFCLMKWIKTKVNIWWLVRTNYPWLFNNSLSQIFPYCMQNC